MSRNKIHTKIVTLLAVSFSVFCLFTMTLQSLEKAKTPQQMILEQLGTDRAVMINGDDFGRTEWSNQGIVKAFEEGVLTSTTLMVPALARNDAYEIAMANPGYDVGVHLVLARDNAPGNLYGPVNSIEKTGSFIDENGNFFTGILPLLKADKNEIYEELKAQIDHALENGVDVTHLDCHKGWYHDYNPRTVKPVLALAAKYQLPIRWQGRSSDASLVRKGIVTNDYLVMINGKLTFKEKKKQLLNQLTSLKPGITEFLFHPATGGYTEAEIEMRTGDLQLMLDSDIRAAIYDNGITLVGYKTLRDMQRQIATD